MRAMMGFARLNPSCALHTGAAGASGTRHSPRSLFKRAENFLQDSRIAPRECEDNTSRRRPRPVRDVIAGLDPAIHHLESTLFFQMDARVKPAHDESTITKPGISRRHCERSEAIHSFFSRRCGLLRCARNDGLERAHSHDPAPLPIKKAGRNDRVRLPV
jgi:hypothetical protein